MILGDAITNHHVGFLRPDWPAGSDQDPEQAAQTRAGLLDQLAQEQTRILGFHLPGNGSGMSPARAMNSGRSGGKLMRALLITLFTAHAALASEDIADQYPGSILYSKPVEVIPHVFSAIGATAPPTYENTRATTTTSPSSSQETASSSSTAARPTSSPKALHGEIKACHR